MRRIMRNILVGVLAITMLFCNGNITVLAEEMSENSFEQEITGEQVTEENEIEIVETEELKNNDVSIDMTAYQSNGTDEVRVGATIKFGELNNIPITWRVLDVEDSRILVFCDFILGIAVNKQSNYYTYASSGLAEWCDSFFAGGAFTEEEKRSIISTTLDGGSAKYNLFFLSRSEHDQYFSKLDSGYRPLFPGIEGYVGAPDYPGYIPEKGVLSDDHITYWLRSANEGQWIDVAGYTDQLRDNTSTCINVKLYASQYAACPAFYLDRAAFDKYVIDYAGDTIDESIQKHLFSKNKYLISVVDNKRKPILGAKVTYAEKTNITDANGRAEFNLFSMGTPTITVSKPGYITWTNAGSNYEKKESRHETIVLYPDSGSNLKLKWAHYKSSNSSKFQYDLLTQTKILNLKNNSIGDLTSGRFTIACSALDTDAVKNYQLWQNKNIIAENPDGKFDLNVDQGFVKGGNCFIRVLDKNGKYVDTHINLTFVENAVNKTSSVSLMNKEFTCKVSDSVPFLGSVIGGSELKIDMPRLPVEIQETENKIYIGFNIKACEAPANPDNYYEDVKKKMDLALKVANTNLKEIKKLIKESKDFDLPGGKVSANVIGYAEADLGSSTAKGEIYIYLKGTTPTAGFNTVVVVVPVTVQFKGSCDVKFGGNISYSFSSGTLDGGLDFTLIVNLEAFGGVGVGKTVAVGAYGSAEAEIGARLIGVNSGVQKLDLTGDLGIKAYFGPLSYKKSFAHNTWHIYSQAAVPVTSAIDDTSYDLYDADNFEVESLDYLAMESDWGGYGAATYASSEKINLQPLLEGTYNNAQPVMVSGNDILYAAFLRADAGTNAVYVACTKMENGAWCNPVRADSAAILDDAPQLLVDGNGIIWMAYARTAEGTALPSLSEYANAQSIVVGTLNPETLAFTEVKEFKGLGYTHMQQLALVNGNPTLAWIGSTITDDDSVLVPTENKLFMSSYDGSAWADASMLYEWQYPVNEIAVGETGVACNVDMDADMNTTEDRILNICDWSGNLTESATGITGRVSYGRFPGQERASFIWNDTDALCTDQNSLTVPGITNEYQIIGDNVYYSMAVGDSAELSVVRKNSDGSYGEPIQLTESGLYLENLSVLTLDGEDIALGMGTSATMTENDVDITKNLVWTVIRPVNDLRIDSADYDTDAIMAGEDMSITLAVTNVGDQKVNQIHVYVNQEEVATESVDLEAGQSKDIAFSITYPSALTDYEIQVTSESGISADYTPDDNNITVKLGYINLDLNASIQRVGNSRCITAEILNNSIGNASGIVAMYDEGGQLIAEEPFQNLENSNVLLVQFPIQESLSDSTASVVVTPDQEELLTYNNAATVYIPEMDDGEIYDESSDEDENVIITVKYSDDVTADKTIVMKKNAVLTSDQLPDPVREGYKFNGWVDENQNKIIIPLNAEQDMVLLATWVKDSENTEDEPDNKPGNQVVKFTVSFMVDGMPYDNKEVKKDAKVEEPTIPTKEGYEFLGWYNGDIRYDFDTPVTEDMELTAKWKKIVDYGEIEDEDRPADEIIPVDFWVAGVYDTEYTGKAVTFDDLRVYFGNRLLTKNVDYTVKYKNNKKVGKASVIIIGKGNYKGTKTVFFSITQAKNNGTSIAKAIVKNWIGPQIYFGGALKEDAEIYVMGTKLTEGTDYIVTYKNNVNAGTATVIYRGIGNYSGTLQKTFKIIPLSISGGGILKSECTKSVPMAKAGAKPQVTVKYNGKLLKEGKDYTLAFKNNKKLGTAFYTIKGKGNFKGSVKGGNYQVVEQNISGLTVIVPDVAFKNKAKIYKAKPTVYDLDGTALKAGTDYSKSYVYTYENDTTINGAMIPGGTAVSDKDIIPAGTVIRVTIKGIKNYGKDNGEVSGLFRIIGATKSIAKAKVKITEKVCYTGKPVTLDKDKISVTVKGVPISANDFEIISYTNNTKKGTATVLLHGIGEYGGFKTVKFKINAKDIL